MSNPGTAAQPWSTLEAIFAANKTFSPGDVIVLHSGYHGAPTVKGNNSGNVTIRPESGATPKLRSLLVKSGSRWFITGLDVCPEHEAPGATIDGRLVDIEASATRITLENCRVRTVLSTAGWTLDNWKLLPKSGIRTAGEYTTLSNNRIETVAHGISLRRTASFTVVSRNFIKGFSFDGIQALADDALFEYNTITDAYVADSAHNHDDFFQGWSVGGINGTTVGEGTLSRVTLRGNSFISRTDPAQPFASNPQGIGLFDGYFEDWVIENNLVVSGTTHGIALYGAINCRVVNNTVVGNPLPPASTSRPWITIKEHKTRATPSSGNLVRNNITASAVNIEAAGSTTADHNQASTNYTSYFTNAANLDFTLKSTAPAVGAGFAGSAPVIDILQRTRTNPYDLGAYEHITTTLTAYQQWLQANELPVDGSGSGAPNSDPLGDGVANEMKFALGLPVMTRGYGGRFSTGTVVVSDKTYLSLSYTYPDPPPPGVTYEAQSAPDLASWSSTTTVQVSNTVTGGLRTSVFRDTIPIGEGPPRRFIRLVAEAP